MRCDSLGPSGVPRSIPGPAIPVRSGFEPGRPLITTVAPAPCGRPGSSPKPVPDPEPDERRNFSYGWTGHRGAWQPRATFESASRAAPFPVPLVGFRRSARAPVRRSGGSRRADRHLPLEARPIVADGRVLTLPYAPVGTWESTLIPKPKTQNPKPKTQNPKPKTQNPKPAWESRSFWGGSSALHAVGSLLPADMASLASSRR
jgi:hypothetical protein